MTSSDAPAAPAELGTTVDGYRWDLDVLRILAILGVVAIHVIGLILARDDLRGTPTWYFGLVVDLGSIWCVPVFVMISGALLLAPEAHRGGPAVFWRRRLVRLLPALVFWHLVYVIGVRILLFGHDVPPAAWFVKFLDTNLYTALYFLWLILGLYAVAPVVAAFLAGGGRRRAMWFAVVACVWTAVLVALPGITAQLGIPRGRSENVFTLWLSYVGIFVAGYACREAQAAGRRWLWTGAASVLLLAFGIWQYDVRPDHAWLQAITPVGYYTLPTVVASACLFVCVIDLCSRLRPSARVQAVLKTLGRATFGVFLSHLLFLALVRKWAPDFHDDPSPAAKLALYGAVVVLAFATSLLGNRIPVVRRVF